MRQKLIAVAAVLLAVTGLGAAGCGTGSAKETTADGVPTTLRVGLIPNIAPEQQKAKYRPFADYLQKKLGVTVELFVASDYAGVVGALAGRRLDLAYLGGLTYTQAEQQVPLTPLVTEVDHETGTERYVSAIVVRRDSPYRDLAKDIVSGRKVFAFGDVGSTSGSLYPRIMLTGAGAKCSTRKVDQCPPLERVAFTGGHDATAQAVLSGKADAGGVELRILHRLESEGTVPKGALRVIAQREVQGYPWVMRSDLGAKAAGAVRAAFLSIGDPKLLELMRARQYAPARPGDYDEVRREAKRLGLLEVSRP
jgi:phosphonate transport system substrate-binding protein